MLLDYSWSYWTTDITTSPISPKPALPGLFGVVFQQHLGGIQLGNASLGNFCCAIRLFLGFAAQASTSSPLKADSVEGRHLTNSLSTLSKRSQRNPLWSWKADKIFVIEILGVLRNGCMMAYATSIFYIADSRAQWNMVMLPKMHLYNALDKPTWSIT